MIIDVENKRIEIGDLVRIGDSMASYRMVILTKDYKYGLLNLSTGRVTCIADDIKTLIDNNHAILIAKNKDLKLK